MHVDGAGYVPDIAPDFDKTVMDDVGVRRFLHRCKGICSDDGSAIKIGLKRENSREGVVESHHYGRDHERHCA